MKKTLQIPPVLAKIHDSLAARSIVSICLIMFVILGVMTAVNVRHQSRLALQNKIKEAEGFSNVVLTAIRHPMLVGEQDIIQQQFENYSRIEEFVAIHLIDDVGVIKRSTEAGRIGTRSQAADLDRVLAGEMVAGLETRKYDGRMVFSRIVPILNEQKCTGCHGHEKRVLGALRLAYDWEPVLDEVRDIFRRNAMIFLYSLLFMLGLTIVFLMRSIVRPILRLQAGMSAVAKGDFCQKIEPRGNDEIASLTRLFNSMTVSLGDLVNGEQARNEELRVLNDSLSNEIAERETIERKLRTTSRQLADIIDFLPDPTFVVDKEKKVIAWNRAIEELTGMSKDRILGKGENEYSAPFYGSPHPVLIDLLVDGYKDRGDRRGTVTAEKFAPGLNGGKGAYVMVTASLLFDSEGNFTGAIESIRDMSEWKKAQEKLKEAMATKAKFLSVVSHELRTPLTSIREGIAIVLDGAVGAINDEQKDFLDTAKRNVDRLGRLINSVLDFQKLESGKMSFLFDEYDINEAVNEVFRGMASMVQAKGLVFSVDLDPAAGRIRFDRDKIIQVVINLVNNSAKFTSQGSIRISTRRTGDSICVRVDDTGPGIAEENLPLLFQSFQQFGDESVRKGGSGLGLAISKEIVERHFGKIWAESRVGQGSAFIFTLPLHMLEGSLADSIEREREKIEAGWVFFLFSARLAPFEQLRQVYGNAKVSALMQRVVTAFQTVVGAKEMVTMQGPDQVFVFAQILREKVGQLRADLGNALKETVCGSDDMDIDFLTAGKVYPDDAQTVRELLEKTSAALMSESARRRNKRIMIVDDDPKAVDVLRQFLMKFGYSDIVLAYDGQEALDMITAHAPDLVILDMQMPRMSGYEVIGRLKGDVKTKDIPLLIISGYEVLVDRIQEYFQKEAIPMIGKPFDKAHLEKWLCYLL